MWCLGQKGSCVVGFWGSGVIGVVGVIGFRAWSLRFLSMRLVLEILWCITQPAYSEKQARATPSWHGNTELCPLAGDVGCRS